MRPSDYKTPEHRKLGKSVINDRIIHIPKPPAAVPGKAPQAQDPFVFPGWEHPDLFGNDHPVKVEYCSGNGAWIAARALAHPEVNWVAVEMKLGRTRKIWSKIKNLNLKNLIVINGEGEYATVNFLPKNCVDAIFINFPDPWPKRHHAKNRIIKPSFVEAMAQLLKDNGEITVVTDDPGFSDWTLKIFKGNLRFTNRFSDPYYVAEWPNYGDSYFEALWRQQGKTIRYHNFQKQS